MGFGKMLEQLLIFTRGGLILWTCKEIGNALKGSPIDTLIRSCLLEERSGEVSFNYGAYTLKWTFHNELGLVFVAVYQKILQLLYVDDLLSIVKQSFSEMYDPKRMRYDDFEETFRQLSVEAEARAEEMKRTKQVVKPLNGVKKQGQVSKEETKKSNGEKKDDEGKVSSVSNGNHKMEDDVANGKENSADNNINSVGVDVSKLAKLRSKGVRGRGGLRKADSLGSNKGSSKVEPPKKATKKNRVWDDAAAAPKQEEKLDFTDENGDNGHVDVVAAADQGESMMDKEEVFSSDSESEDDDDDEPRSDEKPEAKKKGWFSSVFQSITGKANLERTDLEPALKALKERLMTKNVGAMEDALIRILTPRRSIDIMRDVHAAKEQRRPYVVVFVGVNGVGKSTNLAKVAYWLQQHKVSVMMAACDTFRSGAVEQLRTHARRLQIPIFEKGYEKDPAVVAKEAIQEATRNGSDVVLVDTAGRMQDNEPLMRALSKLINLNKPDLVLFVGEALVGNDAVDQLSKFNQKLSDLSTSGNTRLIDGILLTKFDTIDDKVGAALSMVYISGAPVMFVGCGQSYTDLKKLNVKAIVKTLLK
ncbi:hypothetical protein HID58_012993 [Brassica napus]|uniref:SRP54-type proteins GTP-binding domain-containing protein n=1 Tax=Brassica napus TaxID=3708 RepID=A0ABQ8E2P9_BRANA|nr:hypothetical protein HID58_012993 [Brassica napus]